MFFINFKMGTNNFALPMEHLSEVAPMMEITKVSHNLPNYFLGIMTLRNEVLSIIDLRIKLDLDTTITDNTGILICKLNDVKFGLVVDYIFDIVDYNESEVTLSPALPGQFKSFFKHIIRKNQQLILVLEINQLLDITELDLLKSHSTAS
jgi:purine-binding chemotaxis protein CheW